MSFSSLAGRKEPLFLDVIDRHVHPAGQKLVHDEKRRAHAGLCLLLWVLFHLSLHVGACRGTTLEFAGPARLPVASGRMDRQSNE